MNIGNMAPRTQISQSGNLDLVKQINLASVFRLLDKGEPISRIQLAQSSQLAPASITKITRQFIEIGLISEVSTQASTGGRRAVSLALNQTAFCVLAIRLGRSSITLALYDLSASLQAEQRVQLTFYDQLSLENEIISLTEQFLQTYPIVQQKLIAIAVTLPGIITNVVHYMPHLSVDKWALATRLMNHFQIQAYIGHDIRSLALAEHYFGSTAACDDSIFIRIHNGVGAGIILNGQMLLGKKGHLGEIGHIQIDPLGQRCHCGNIGCLETILSNPALIKDMQRLIQSGATTQLVGCSDDLTIFQIIEAALAGDTLACELIQRAGHFLGKIIAQLVNLLNPEKIVLSGELVAAHKLLIPSIERWIQNTTLPNFHQLLELGLSSLDHQSAIGSFAIVKQALFDGSLLMKLLDENQIYREYDTSIPIIS